MAKTYSQTYLFKQYDKYEKQIYEFIVSAERIDTNGSEFADILYDIKRRKISDSLAKVLTSSNLVLGITPNAMGLPKAFKTFVAADVKDGSKPKAFIDASNCITFKNGVYNCSKIEWLISYVISAMTSYIYVRQPNKLTGNANILKEGGDAWVRCFSYVIDRMYKISTVQDLKRKLDYLAAMYYQINILEKDPERQSDSIQANAIRISGIDPKMAKIVDINLIGKEFTDIDTFVVSLGKLLGLRDIKTGNVVSLWMSAFGTGTVFALEYFPAFSMMLTNAYVGGYIDQQNTIEKITGASMVKFVKTVLEIGANVV